MFCLIFLLGHIVLVTELMASLRNRNSANVECESKSDASNKTGDWNHFKITQTIPEQHNMKNTKLRNCKKHPY